MLDGDGLHTYILYLWGTNPLAYFSLLFSIETCLLRLGEWCTAAFDA